MVMFASASSHSSFNTVDSQLTVKEDEFTKELISLKEHFELELKKILKRDRSKPGAGSKFHQCDVAISRRVGIYIFFGRQLSQTIFYDVY